MVVLIWTDVKTGERGVCRGLLMPRAEAEELVDMLLQLAWPHGFDYRIERSFVT